MKIKNVIFTALLLCAGSLFAQYGARTSVQGYVYMFGGGMWNTHYFLVDDFGNTYGLPYRFHRLLQNYHYRAERVAVTGALFSYICYGPPCPNFAFGGRVLIETAVMAPSPPIPTPRPPLPPQLPRYDSRVEGYVERYEVRQASQTVVAYYLVDGNAKTYSLPASFDGRMTELYEARTRIAVTGDATLFTCVQAPCPNYVFGLFGGTVLIELLE